MKKVKSPEEMALDRIKKFLDEPIALPLQVRVEYTRAHDDHDGTFEGSLKVHIGPDGDVWFTTDKHMGAPLRFRMPIFGGGMSPRTYNALRLLAYAIALDNEERPERKPTQD